MRRPWLMSWAGAGIATGAPATAASTMLMTLGISFTVTSRPYLARDIDHEAQLLDLGLLGHAAAARRRHAAREAALGRDRELVERHETRGVIDAALQCILAFEHRGLG